MADFAEASPQQDEAQKPSKSLKTKPVKESAAAKLLRARAEAAQEAAKLLAQHDAETNVYYLKCPRVEDHIAAFLTGNPRAKFGPGEWESTLHEAGSAWTSRQIPCQECFAAGEQRVWGARVRPVPRADGSYDFVFDGERRHAVGVMPRAAFDDAKSRISALFGKETSK